MIYKCSIEGCDNKSSAIRKQSPCSKHKTAKWRKQDIEHARKIAMDYYRENRDRILIYNKTENMQNYKRKWNTENKVRRRDATNKIAHKASRTINARYRVLKSNAKIRNLEMNILIEEFRELLNKKCYYCSGNLPETGASLDRLNNLLGYVKDNVVPCCTNCNRIKCHLLSTNETIEVIKLLKQLRERDNIWSTI